MSRLTPTEAELLVLRAQAILHRYLPPDSGMRATDVVNDMLELFERPEALAISDEFEDRLQYEVARPAGIRRYVRTVSP